MTTAVAMPGDTTFTFLTHFFGRSLADERYVVERFQAMADGDVHPWPGEAPAARKERRKPKRVNSATTRPIAASK